jgi:hypothetical protein
MMVVMQISLLVAASMVLNRNQTLTEQAETYREWAAPLRGRNVPAITGVDRTGAKRAIDYKQDPRPTLVYTFSQNCPACKANWTALRSIQALSPTRLRIVYIDPFDVLSESYLREHGLTQDVLFTRLDPFSEVSYQLRGTPQTELVDSQGRAIWTNVGAFRPSDLAALRGAIEKQERQSEQTTKGAEQ